MKNSTYEEYENKPLYKIGNPEIHSGIKFYPVFQKDIGVFCSALYARYAIIVEYFKTKEEAAEWIKDNT